MEFSWFPGDWITADDLEDPRGCPSCTTGDAEHAEFVANVIAGASETLYILTARTIGQITGTALLPAGRMTGRVQLPGPITSITSITLDGEAVEFDFEVRDGFLVLDDDWYDPTKDMELVVSWGAPVPDVGRQACVDLVCAVLRNPSRWCQTAAPGATSASFQGTSVTIDPDVVRESGIGSVKLLIELLNPQQQRQPSVCVSPDFLDLDDASFFGPS